MEGERFLKCGRNEIEIRSKCKPHLQIQIPIKFTRSCSHEIRGVVIVDIERETSHTYTSSF